MFFLLGIMLGWRLTLYLKVEPLALLNLHHYISTIHMLIGASTGTVFKDLNYTALYTAVAGRLLGKAGGMFLLYIMPWSPMLRRTVSYLPAAGLCLLHLYLE